MKVTTDMRDTVFDADIVLRKIEDSKEGQLKYLVIKDDKNSTNVIEFTEPEVMALLRILRESMIAGVAPSEKGWKTFTKTVAHTGNTLYVPLTKELKKQGYTLGDEVLIAIKRREANDL